MRRYWLLATFLLFIYSTRPQTPAQYSSADIYLMIKRLNVLGSVLYVAAHPDDENTRLLAYFSKERLFRTGYLSLTRGDGGQNLIGGDQGIELGLIRTQELLSARRIDGAEQFFSRAYDFGFTKSTEEALQTWNKDQILSDVVWIIRKFQPDVIITRFPEDSRAGHGQHSASSLLAREAFKAAADPNRFPEQLQYGVQPWQAKRIMWNAYTFSNDVSNSNAQLRIDVGGFNALMGKSYGEIAAASRSQHKSQGFGIPASRGSQSENFSLIDGPAATQDPFDGVNVSWSRVPGAASISGLVDSIASAYAIGQPQLSVPALVQLYRRVKMLPEGYWKTQTLSRLRQIIAACDGIWLEATANSEFGIQGDPVRVAVAVNNRSGAPASLRNIKLDGSDSAMNITLQKDHNYNFVRTLNIPLSKPVSQPYWLEHPMTGGSFSVPDQAMIGKPENEPAYTVQIVLNIEGEDFTFGEPIRYKFTDPVKGELYQPLVVVPPVTVSLDPAIAIFRKGARQHQGITVTLTANTAIQQHVALISAKSNGGNQSRTDSNFSVTKGGTRPYIFDVSNDNINDGTDSVYASATLTNGATSQTATLDVRSIQYDHIPHIHYFLHDGVAVLNIDLKTAGKKVGYIEGAGDKVPVALQQMGYEVTILKEGEISPANLRNFDAVITGVRAFNVHDYLSSKHDVLMEYVHNGGNLIIQYNTTNFAETADEKLGPYQFVVSRQRVTDQTADVQFLLPQHRVLNFPNKITAADFSGWVQERAIYDAESLDDRYETPLSMADPGEQPQKGSLIIANYGKGTFVYTGLVFFRELPAGVPGAYRLLANIIALNRKNAF